MLIKRSILLFLINLTISNQYAFCYENKALILEPSKDQNWSLRPDFLKQIKSLFNPVVFVETGTFMGNTTILAASMFKQVYSTELSHNLYEKAKARFDSSNQTNIHLFNNDSPQFLSKIIPQINAPILIFLDAHWSEGITAKGDCNTPIINELDVIKNQRQADCVILIDDIRCFQKNRIGMEVSHQDYPPIDILIQKGQEIFESLGFAIFGDVAIMYDANLHQINHSKIIQALTQYKIASLDNNITQEKIIKLCNTIGAAKDTELDGIIDLTRLTNNENISYLNEDILIWRACTLLKQNSPDSAINTLRPLIKRSASSFNLKFVNYILEQCCIKQAS